MKPAFPCFIASLLLLGGATACSKEDAAPQEEFFLRATKNSTPWTATGTGTFNKTSGQLYVFGTTGEAAQSELLSIGVALPAAPQLAPAQALRTSRVTLVGGDAVTNSYVADDAKLPIVEITRLDTVAKVVEGRFTTTLLREKRWTAQEEALRFTDGSFRIHYTPVQ